MTTRRVKALVAGTICLVLPSATWSAEFCVSCLGPDTHYACTFDGVTADPGDSRLQLYCITELAKAGKHASCSVDRKQNSPCVGELKKLAAPGGYDFSAPPAVAGTPVSPADTVATPPANPPAAPQQPAPAAAETTIPKKEMPPKTVQEMVEKSAAGKTLEKGNEAVGEAAKATGSALEKAGQAVGKAAKKTWTCITSLFGDC